MLTKSTLINHITLKLSPSLEVKNAQHFQILKDVNSQTNGMLDRTTERRKQITFVKIPSAGLKPEITCILSSPLSSMGQDALL